MYKLSNLQTSFSAISGQGRYNYAVFHHQRCGNIKERTKKSAECLINQTKRLTFPLKSLCEFPISFFNQWEAVQVGNEQHFKLHGSFSLEALSVNDGQAIINMCLEQDPGLSIPSTDLLIRGVADR